MLTKQSGLGWHSCFCRSASLSSKLLVAESSVKKKRKVQRLEGPVTHAALPGTLPSFGTAGITERVCNMI